MGRTPLFRSFFWNFCRAAGSILVYRVMSTPLVSKKPAVRVPEVAPQEQVMASLFEGPGMYPQRKDTFLYSFIFHLVAMALVIWSGHWAFEHKDQIQQQVVSLA